MGRRRHDSATAATRGMADGIAAPQLFVNSNGHSGPTFPIEIFDATEARRGRLREEAAHFPALPGPESGPQVLSFDATHGRRAMARGRSEQLAQPSNRRIPTNVLPLRLQAPSRREPPQQS